MAETTAKISTSSRKKNRASRCLTDCYDQAPSSSGCNDSPDVAEGQLKQGAQPPGTFSEVKTPSPAEYQKVFRKALEDPTSMSRDDIKELAAAICQSAIRKVNYAPPAAEFCLAIIERYERVEREVGEAFLENLLLLCRELFNSRDKVLRHQPTIRSRRWVAYVTFLAELLRGLSDAQVRIMEKSCRSGAAVSTAKAKSMMVLSTLLCVSCHAILPPTPVYNPTEMDCLRTALTTAGAALEREAPERLAALMRVVEAVLEVPDLPIRSRHVLQDVMALKASNWQPSL